jgi:hypothetical protein
MILGSFRDFVEYDTDHPGVVANVMDGMRTGRLKLCPIVSSSAEATSMENKLRRLFAERRRRDHCKMYLHPSIPSRSKHINPNDIQIVLDALRDGWGRSSPSDIGVCGKADAMRVSIVYSFLIISVP